MLNIPFKVLLAESIRYSHKQKKILFLLYMTKKQNPHHPLEVKTAYKLNPDSALCVASFYTLISNKPKT